MIDRKPVCFFAGAAGNCRDWEPGRAYNAGDQILPATKNSGGLTYSAQTSDTTGTNEPDWPQTVGQTVQDGAAAGGVRWVAQDTISRHYVRVDFSDPHSADTADLNSANLTITTLPSGKTLTTSAAGKFNTGFGNQVATFEMPETATVPPGDTSIKVCFANYHFADKAVTGLCGEGKIYNDTNIGDLVEDSKKALSDAVSTSRSSAEKNIFAGLSISVPSGGGDAQGSGDLNLNKYFDFPLLGQGIAGLEIKKGTSENADPRHLSGGLTARKTWLLAHRTDIDAVTAAIQSGSADANATAVSALARIQKTFFRSIYLDNGISYEGDISDGSLGNISNVLYNGETWINTAPRPLTRDAGFFNFRILPIGIEAGYNVSANSPVPISQSPSAPPGFVPTEGDSLARLKSGATFILSTQSPYSTEKTARLDLEVGAVNRYLFEDEISYDSKSKSYSRTGTGNKYWAQVALKALAPPVAAGSISGRPGLKLAFQRGFLPPVYAFTKVFTISLIYETNDDTSEDIKLVNKK